LTDLEGDVPGVMEAIREIGDPRWRSLAQARTGQPVTDVFLKEAIETLSHADCEVDDVELVVAILPFAPTHVVSGALAEVGRLLDEDVSRGMHESVSRGIAKVVRHLDDEVISAVVSVTARITPEDRAP